MAVTQYIGARYVPLFAEGEWTSKVAYEPLTVVLYEGSSYTSKQAVPVGVSILNENYWVCTGNYNAQVEAYRKETAAVASSLSEIKTSVTAETERATAAEDSINETLENIEQEYAKCYDTVAAMKADTDITSGMIVHTNGYHSRGDGGAAWYVMLTGQTANEMDIIQTSVSTLCAVMVIIDNIVTPEMFGAYGDYNLEEGADNTDAHDDYTAINRMISLAIPSNLTVNATKDYLIGTPITIDRDDYTTFTFNGSLSYLGTDAAVILKTSYANIFIHFVNSPNGNGIKLTQEGLAYARVLHENHITYDRIIAGNDGFQIVAGNHGIIDTTIICNEKNMASRYAYYLFGGTGNTSTQVSYIGEAVIRGGRLGGQYGCYLDASQGHEITGLTFEDLSLEDCDNGVYLNAGTTASGEGRVAGCKFKNIRTEEYATSQTLAYFNGNVRLCEFELRGLVYNSWFTNNCDCPANRMNKIKGMICGTNADLWAYELLIFSGSSNVTVRNLAETKRQNIPSTTYTWDGISTPINFFGGYTSGSTLDLGTVPYLNRYGVNEILIYNSTARPISVIDSTISSTDKIFDSSTGSVGFHCIRIIDWGSISSLSDKYSLLY